MMLEYACFDFGPLGGTHKCSALNMFFDFVSTFEMKTIESFSIKIAQDVLDGLMYLHSKGIAHRDLKPANILVTNQHYANISDKHARDQVLKASPIVCKLTDFGESRSATLQTRSLLETNTRHVHRGTIGFMAPEQFSGALKIAKASQSQLMKIDVWQFGMTLFCLINPNLTSPFEIELCQRRSDPDINPDELIGTYLNMGRLSEMSADYYFHRKIYWSRLLKAYLRGTEIFPNNRANLHELKGVLNDVEEHVKNRIYYPLSLSQGTALEKFDNFVVAGQSSPYPKNDGTNCCSFLCLKIAENLTELSSNDFEEIAGRILNFFIYSVLQDA